MKSMVTNSLVRWPSLRTVEADVKTGPTFSQWAFLPRSAGLFHMTSCARSGEERKEARNDEGREEGGKYRQLLALAFKSSYVNSYSRLQDQNSWEHD
jgi:hypothetical protein